jgi:hypothetical protein
MVLASETVALRASNLAIRCPDPIPISKTLVSGFSKTCRKRARSQTGLERCFQYKRCSQLSLAMATDLNKFQEKTMRMPIASHRQSRIDRTKKTDSTVLF